MTWRIPPFRAIVLLFAVGVNAWLLVAVAAEVASGDPSVMERGGLESAVVEQR